MGQGVQINHPEVLNMDKAKKSLAPNEMFYALNHNIIETSGVATPYPANYLGCVLELPEGDNYSIGSPYFELTNETYVCVANVNNNHLIYRITGDDGYCEKVYEGECLQRIFGTVPDVFNPKHSIEQFRCQLLVEKICANRHGKRLIITNGLGEVACIDVEASIATNFFSTYFFTDCESECAPLLLCVPQSCDCITAEFLPLAEEDRGITNKIVDVGLKFIYRHVYYDLRASEWSAPSSLYYQDSKGCFSSTEGFPRCIELTIPLGNPLVDKIEIGYSTDNGVNWLLSDTVEKYDSYTSSNQYWYERSISSELNRPEECYFKYTFCNDKQCIALDPEVVNRRAFNPMPRQPQAVVTIKEALGYLNYIQGTCPLDKNETDKFSITPVCEDEGECEVEYAKVKVRAIVHNFIENANTPIFRHGGVYGNTEDDVNDTAYFGVDIDGGLGELPYNSHFAGKKRNFTAYIEGTNYFSEMKQWKADEGFQNNEEVGIVSGLGALNEFIRGSIFKQHSWYWYQETTFTVKKGTKGFIRLQSHESTSNTSNTSTYVRGTLDDISDYRRNSDVPSLDFNTLNREIYFDTTAGDVDLTEAFVIENPVANSDSGNHSSALFYGYLKLEDGTPIEYAEIFRDPDTMVTDHNGFFFRTYRDIDSVMDFDVKVEQNCSAGFSMIKEVTLSGGYGFAAQTNITLLDTETEDYRDDFLANTEVTVLDCDDQPVGGLRIAMSGSKARTTGADGIARFKIRNISTRDRVLRAILMDGGTCFLRNCDNECDSEMPTLTENVPACLETTPDIIFDTMVVNTSSLLLNNRGLKKGGRYGFGIVAEGQCGRISAVYELPDGFINIPKLQENEIAGFCSFDYNAGNIVLPDWVNCLKIVRTANLNPFELQWVVDKIEKTTDGKTKLTIQSLNDYNSNYFFKTNTVYKFLQGDRVEFIKNGDGTILTVDNYGLLNFQTLSPFKDEDLSGEQDDVDYFNQLLIDDDGKLDDIEEGAIIEIQRAKECVDEPTYFSICVSLQVENGSVVEQTGSFTTFDTYLVNRTIGEFYQQTFEHHSPSDFWGEKLSDIGKAYFVNKYENERRYGRNITVASPTQINYFGDIEKTFDAPQQGDIVAARLYGRQLQAICEYGSFMAQVADDLVRVGTDGTVRAARPDEVFSDPNIEGSNGFGCQYSSVGSVLFEGWGARFVDVSKSADVIHDFNLARDVTIQMVDGIMVGRTKTYYKRRCSEIQLNNATQGENYLDHYRFVTGYSNHWGTIFSTIKKLTQSGVNNSDAPYIQGNETLVFHPVMNAFLTFASFTPEHYSFVRLNDAQGCNFLCFLNGQAYNTPINPTEWNEFFGQSVNWVVGISMNIYPNKIKRGLSIEVQDATALWYVKEVKTEVAGWLSEVPVVKSKRSEDKVNLAFLGNVNSRQGLYGSDKPRGYFHSVLFKRDHSVDLKVNTTDAAKQKAYSELNLIIFKFLYSEQSGLLNSNQ